MYKLTSLAILFIIILAASGCTEKEPEPKGTPEYIAEIEQWHQKRIERLKKDTGWLNLVGLYWLKEGENTFGSSEKNDIKFPDNSPQKIGTIILKDSLLTFKSADGVDVLNNDVKVTVLELKDDLTGMRTTLASGSLRWYIIKRGERYGIRLRDVESPILKEFKDIDIYPINEDWRIEATFIPYDPPKPILIPNILGTTEEDNSPGALSFTKDGRNYKLDAIESRNGFFIIFADETSGKETYGAGRFLYTDRPDSNNKVILDFNISYNPPCVFTKYATCPLPPKQNYLHLKITAGEKMWGELH
ncbi:MAG: DUF1684 domain-containing protein [Bacteroidetes bacterium]|nr:DUF1684 domain-containing protein [Bacteroidota bacterium]